MSVKSLARTEGAGGAVRREELEGPADGVQSPADWPASDARSLVLELAGDAPLVELVTIRQQRRERIVKTAEARVEASLDEVEVVSDGRVVDCFRRARGRADQGRRRWPGGTCRGLRGRPGPGSRDWQQARDGPRGGSRATMAWAPLAMPGSRSRSRRAFGRGPRPRTSSANPSRSPQSPIPRPRHASRRRQDARCDPGRPHRGGRPEGHAVPPRPDARARGRDAAGGDPEELHAMRVATRRQRAAWRVFGASFRGRTSRYRNGLREIASRLGAVRDLDVLLEAADLYPRRPADPRAAGDRAAPDRMARSTATTPRSCSSAS